jgi:metal-dependent amidase/aminoacylase/carboxypeptidase family protein
LILPLKNIKLNSSNELHLRTFSYQGFRNVINPCNTRAKPPNLIPYESRYKRFRLNPELSHQVKETAVLIASKLESIDVTNIHRHIGGHGVTSVVENGVGKTVLLRAYINGLAVEELTRLGYASKTMKKDDEGHNKPVMHACGHDMHITTLLAATELLLEAKDKWSGTLISCFQPAEEKGDGAVG